MDNCDSLGDSDGLFEAADPATRTIYIPTQAGWFVDPIPGSPATRWRYFDGTGWTERTHDPTRPRPQPPPPVEATSELGPGLRAHSGFVAGLAGGTVGLGAALALIPVMNALGSSTLGRAILALPAAGFGAVLAATLLTTNAAMIDRRTWTRWLVRGLLLGAAVGTVGFAGAALVWADAQDGDGRMVLAVMVFYGSLGLSIGLATGVARGGAVLWTGLAGGTAGVIASLFSGPFFVIAAPIIAAAIGAAIGAIRPRQARQLRRSPYGGDSAP